MGQKGRKVVITYGTFDMLHIGHLNLLKRAKELGDYLIVGVTSENYDKARGKLNVRQSLVERIENVRKSGLANLIIVEEYEGQKIDDIKKYNVDIFAIGSDWEGKFDYLREFCEVVYLPRTKGISSTELRGYLNLGIVGCGRIAKRFLKESKFISGVNCDFVYHPNKDKARQFAEANELCFYHDNLEEFLSNVDAIYVATPHDTHYFYTKTALENGKHVLCEKPMVLSRQEAEELFDLANEKNLVLFEAIKTAYFKGFNQIVNFTKTGKIGVPKSVEATFTKISIPEGSREFDYEKCGGSVTELSSYVLLPIMKVFGVNYKDVVFYTYTGGRKVDVYTIINVIYNHGIGIGKVGIGVKSEGELIISGEEGYIYTPSPWWLTDYFEVRREDFRLNRRFSYPLEGEGLRYELAAFVQSIRDGNTYNNHYVTKEESIAIAAIVEKFLKKENVVEIN
ncbi:MAG: hypothetical protein PWQ73_472 [Petrotoga sp.]|nr:hypothetical protein [Petrotoga sp.]